VTVRADHVAGAAFVLFGILVIALSGDLPAGRLAMPGSGFLPKLVAGLTIVLGAALFLRARESAPYTDLGWSDGGHAAMVVAATAFGAALYTVLGFILTLSLMMIGALVVIERRNPLRAAAYSVSVVLLAYLTFSYLLKTPLPRGPLGF
jgi:putative tricarboxylic transport membrane protein